jgi:hypothetical protein
MENPLLLGNRLGNMCYFGDPNFFWLERSQGTTCADCPNLSLVLDFLDEREAEAGQIFGAAKDMNFPDGDAWKC